MEKKTLNTLFMIASSILALAGLVFILISMFGDNEPSWVLSAGLLCVCVGNVFNVIRLWRKDK